MARKKRTAEDQLLQIINDLGWERTDYILGLYKNILKPKNKKSPETDPNLKAEERTNEPPNITPTE